MRTLTTNGIIVGAGAAAAAAITAAIGYRRAAMLPLPPYGAQVDWWIVAYTALAIVCTRGLFLDAALEHRPSPSPPHTAAPRLRAALVTLAAYYSFGGIILGTQDLGACNMYSNLRMYGRTNHLLFPTAALGTIWSPAAEALTLVRVESCTSKHINSLYPGELTTRMAPHELELLRSAGHSARMFNAMKARVLGPELAPTDAPWSRYTVPAIELRRLLTEARSRSEAFTLTYTVLSRDGGDERWRRTSRGRTVTLVEDGHGGRRCSVVGGGMLGVGSGTCNPDELALLPPPGFWPTRFFVAQPYPILEEAADFEGEIVCFGP